ncbi:hypothetical protein [Endozoicomonas sp. SCSIO W0465]|uniref:hypothetical protein n=1 Tax=Endozoicomonas sp. SCSIO W0465 TaxID=2918516 RepID=UPI0020754269|nr:hypothetical protein [Endozoicomonas sp. SCSIO W0465]USE33816.1 hypothetical protein MJO57_16710 [Endozoicomonas sp. SCSIO W0465]
MNLSIGQSSLQHNESAPTSAGQSGSNFANPGALAECQKRALPVMQVKPTHSMLAAKDDTLTTKESKSLSEYIVQHCHSLRNLIAATKPQSDIPWSGISPSPENLLDAAEQRLLSRNELDTMQQYIQQQTDITINGQSFKLETLPKDTPLFYQFYCLDQDQKTEVDHVSMRIFRNNCIIEPSRPAIILIHNDLINETVHSQLRQLEEEFENVHVVDVSLLLTGWSPIYGMTITQEKVSDGRLKLMVDGRECKLANIYLGDSKVREYMRHSDIMDILQSVAMFHCDEVHELAGIRTNGPRGCIKIDFDTELEAPIDEIKCPNGFSAFVIDRIDRNSGAGNNELTHSLGVENSLIAVTRPKHRIMAESVCPCPGGIFSNYCNAVRRSFLLPSPRPVYDVKHVTPTRDGIHSLKMLCDVAEREQIAGKINDDQPLSISFNTSTSWKQKIAFPLGCIKADQSRVWGVRSWLKPASTS